MSNVFETHPYLTGTFGAAALLGAIGAWNSFQIVPAQNYGVHVHLGQVLDTHLEPGIHTKYPFIDTIYVLKENTIIMEKKVGSGLNSQDQNALSAEMRLHYKNDPKSGIIAFHVADMANDDGSRLLGSLMDQSFNAAAGSGRAVDSLNDPHKFLADFTENLQWRLNQNNVAIELDAFELLEFNVGNLRMPVQLRFKHDTATGQWKAESIGGVPVPRLATPALPPTPSAP